MVREKLDADKIFKVVREKITTLLQVNHSADLQLVSQISKKTDIFADLGIDSVEVMDLLGMVEREFQATFNIDKFGQRKTMAEIVEFISEQLKESS